MLYFSGMKTMRHRIWRFLKLRFPEEWLYVLAIAATVKIILVWWAIGAYDHLGIGFPGIVEAFNHWDSRAYLTIATEGYEAPSVKLDYRLFLSHFPPLYPLLIKAGVFLTPFSAAAVGFLISLVCGFIASILLYELVRFDFKNEQTALKAVWFFNIFPTAYFMLGIYTESLFLMLSIGSFYALRLGYKWTAGLLGFGAIFTRLPGITLGPVYLHDIWVKLKKSKNIFYLVLPGAAVLLYLVINYFYYGDPLFFMHEYETNPYSAKKMIVPFSETIRDFAHVFYALFDHSLTHSFMVNQGFNAIFVVFALAVSIYGLYLRIPAPYSIYAFSSLLFIGSFGWGISNARYALAIFPIFIVLALIKDKYLLSVLTAVFIFALFFFTRLFALGWWAF